MFTKKNDNNRFLVKSTENVPTLGKFSVVVDQQTGVHYLQSWVGAGSSITPLLDDNGKVVIEKP
ncbi:hypothetical protein JCM19045_168 [Bacillus sp. JCM 19045]|uniref:DUF6440 domain-containing protein n=1 Tax=Shouchella xiaoxiensis TaxID=766895 RepID=A0ABS2SN29_9BACI|nr:DUF6440 family protein [Shouchella xiaoxiensis]MBM7836924.1 hypothetical protein [Shouchella xiaoxiensis]GAF11093.1 hypothetical protein JCM19045_168 [Bacillus sp. JCM 19045]